MTVYDEVPAAEAERIMRRGGFVMAALLPSAWVGPAQAWMTWQGQHDKTGGYRFFAVRQLPEEVAGDDD